MSKTLKMRKNISTVAHNVIVCVLYHNDLHDCLLSVLLCVLAFSELSMSVFSELEDRTAVLSEYQSTVLKH